MSRYKISKGEAIDLQEWTLKESGAKELLNSLPELPKESTTKQGIYVDYDIDEKELDGGMDWPDVGVATIYAIINNKRIYLGEIRAYNFETLWLSTREDDEVDTAENWFELIQEDFQNLIKKNIELIK